MSAHTAKNSKQTYHQGIRLIKDYFLNSNERYSALLLLAGAIICIIGLVALASTFSWWIVGFWEAITMMNLPLFISSIKLFVPIVSGFVIANVVKKYLTETLSVRWRNWLTLKFTEKYLSSHLDLSREATHIDNPQQRIQEDIKTFVKFTLSLSLDLIKSTLMLVTFIGTLWIVGGALTVGILGASITIPGYLVWVAILFTLAASYITLKIGKSLTNLTHDQKKFEADFRKDMEQLNNDSENLAQEHGEQYYKLSLTNKFEKICDNAYQKIQVKLRITSFQSFYDNLSSIFPYLAAAPMYFSGQTTLGQLMQIGMSFGEVQGSLSWFNDSYEKLATYKAIVGRIIELEQGLDKRDKPPTQRTIIFNENETTRDFSISALNIAKSEKAKDGSTQYMLKGLNLRLTRGENTLIKGPSGLGKTTLFKILAGSWKYGEGEITAPNHNKVCFLPQRPSLPHDTLKAVLAYPDPIKTYTNKQYKDALRSVGNMEEFIKDLDNKKVWSKIFSGGEQKRIAVARALLKKPEWLFLDEITTGLDPKSEREVYTLLQNQPNPPTLVSIAHQPTVDVFHKRIVTFNSINDSGVIQFTDERPDDNQTTKAVNDENALSPFIQRLT